METAKSTGAIRKTSNGTTRKTTASHSPGQDSPKKEGWLELRTSDSKAAPVFQRVWCVVEGGILRLFRERGDLDGEIAALQVRDTVVNEHPTNGNEALPQLGFALRCHSANRRFYLRAKSVTDRAVWLSVITFSSKQLYTFMSTDIKNYNQHHFSTLPARPNRKAKKRISSLAEPRNCVERRDSLQTVVLNADSEQIHWDKLPVVTQSNIFRTLGVDDVRVESTRFRIVANEVIFNHELNNLHVLLGKHWAKYCDECPVSSRSSANMIEDVREVKRSSDLLLKNLEDIWQSKLLFKRIYDVLGTSDQKYECFINYCHRLPMCLEVLDDFRKRRPDLNNLFLSSKFQIEAIFLPLLRLQTMQLLLEELHKVLEVSNRSLENFHCVRAKEQISKAVDNCFNALKNGSNSKYVSELQRKLEECYVNYIQLKFPKVPKLEDSICPSTTLAICEDPCKVIENSQIGYDTQVDSKLSEIVESHITAVRRDTRTTDKCLNQTPCDPHVTFSTEEHVILSPFHRQKSDQGAIEITRNIQNKTKNESNICYNAEIKENKTKICAQINDEERFTRSPDITPIQNYIGNENNTINKHKKLDSISRLGGNEDISTQQVDEVSKSLIPKETGLKDKETTSRTDITGDSEMGIDDVLPNTKSPENSDELPLNHDIPNSRIPSSMNASTDVFETSCLENDRNIPTVPNSENPRFSETENCSFLYLNNELEISIERESLYDMNESYLVNGDQIKGLDDDLSASYEDNIYCEISNEHENYKNRPDHYEADMAPEAVIGNPGFSSGGNSFYPGQSDGNLKEEQKYEELKERSEKEEPIYIEFNHNDNIYDEIGNIKRDSIRDVSRSPACDSISNNDSNSCNITCDEDENNRHEKRDVVLNRSFDFRPEPVSTLKRSPSSASLSLHGIGKWIRAAGSVEVEAGVREKDDTEDLLSYAFGEAPLFQEFNSNTPVLVDNGKKFEHTHSGSLELSPSSNGAENSNWDSYFQSNHLIGENVFQTNKKRSCTQRAQWCETEEVIYSGCLDYMGLPERKLQEAKFEIITSEISFYKSLCILHRFYVSDPELVGSEILTSQENLDLFTSVSPVLCLSERFLKDLIEVWENDIMLHGLPELILLYARTHFRAYIVYCSNQVAINHLLSQLSERNKKFNEALERIRNNPACESFSLQSFLTQPMQRITRFPMLVQAILNNISKEDKEYNKWRELHLLLSTLTSECNEAVRNAEKKYYDRKGDSRGRRHLWKRFTKMT